MAFLNDWIYIGWKLAGTINAALCKALPFRLIAIVSFGYGVDLGGRIVMFLFACT